MICCCSGCGTALASRTTPLAYTNLLAARQMPGEAGEEAPADQAIDQAASEAGDEAAASGEGEGEGAGEMGSAVGGAEDASEEVASASEALASGTGDVESVIARYFKISLARRIEKGLTPSVSRYSATSALGTGSAAASATSKVGSIAASSVSSSLPPHTLFSPLSSFLRLPPLLHLIL
jgi:hypothetical protein